MSRPMHRAAMEPIPFAMPAILSTLSVLLLYVGHPVMGGLVMAAGIWWGVSPWTFQLMVAVLAAKNGLVDKGYDHSEADHWHDEKFLPALEEAFKGHWLMQNLLVTTDEEEASLRGRVLKNISWTNWGMAIWPLWASAIEEAVKRTTRKL